MSNNNIEMGSSGSKVKEVCEIKAVEEMDESELSHKGRFVF